MKYQTKKYRSHCRLSLRKCLPSEITSIANAFSKHVHSEYGHDLSNVCEHLEVFKDSDSAMLRNDHMFLTFTYPTGGYSWQNESEVLLYIHVFGFALG